MGNTKDWTPVMERLADQCLCLAIDLPGHGKSIGLWDDAYTFWGAASGVVQVMEKHDVIPATVVGYSMGGRLALYVAMHHRHACSELVLESATAGIPGRTDRTKRLSVDRALANELEQGRFEDFLRTWYCQPIFRTLADAPERLEKLIGLRCVNDPKELARTMRGLGAGTQPSLWHKLSELTLPVLLLAGEKDPKYVDIVQSMTGSLPQGRMAVVPGAGHNAHLERPSVVANHIREFLLKE
jgi:2-succinyl-6-hydroxy-2,4-cyclohexadiene-1-carboxylate synthase